MINNLEVLRTLSLEQPQKIVIVPDKQHLKIGEFDRLNTKNNNEKEKIKKIAKKENDNFSEYLEEEIRKYR